MPEMCATRNRVIMAEGRPPHGRPAREGRHVPVGRRRVYLDESRRAWALIIGVVTVILANLVAIILMNTIGR